MAGEQSIGGIVGFLRLDRSQWSAEIAAATGQAKELGKTNPKIDIETNAPAAIAQLEAVAVAAKRLQDAQGKVSVAQAKVNDLEAAGNTSSTKLAAAKENLAKATRDVEVAQIRLTKAFTDGDSAADSLENSTTKVSNAAKDAHLNLFSVSTIMPAIGAALAVAGPLLAVGAAGLGTLALGASGLKDEITTGLTPAFDALQESASNALKPGVTKAITDLQSILPKLNPLVQTFGAAFGDELDKLTAYLNNGGIQRFTTYAEQELPIVEKLFNDSAAAATKFFGGSTTQGNQLLNEIDLTVQGLGQVAALQGKINDLAGSKPTTPQGDLEAAGAKAFTQVTNIPGTILSNGQDLFKQINALTTTKVSGNGTQTGAAAVIDGVGQSAERMAADMLDAQSATMAATNQVATLAKGLPTANTAIQGLLTGMSAYATSAGDAASKSALLGAVLVASQGDALSYAGAVSAGYAATQSLISTFQQQAADTKSTAGSVNGSAQSAALDRVTAATSRLNAAQIKAGTPAKNAAAAASASAAVASAQATLTSANATLDKASKATGGQSASMAFADTEKAAIDLNTGLINLNATGAAPLVQQLQAMQDAAEKAAEATYQHEVATQGQTKALQDAQDIFESMTGGALVKNAAQLGLNTDQAQKLADQYFAFDGKTVTTNVQSIGLNDVNTTLQLIGQQLAYLTGKPFPITLTLDASTFGKTLHDVVNDIPSSAGSGPAHSAGGDLQEGWGTVGETAPEAYFKSGSKVTIFPLKTAGPSISSPAASSVHASYSTPIYHTTVITLDGKVLTTSTNQVNMAKDRAR